MQIIKHRKIFVLVSLILMALALVFIFSFGLKEGIDFKGGSLLEASYDVRPDLSELNTAVKSAGFNDVLIQPSGEKEILVKTIELGSEAHTKISAALAVKDTGYKEVSFTSIGPSVGKELRSRAVVAIVLVLTAIILFIAYVFRKVSKPVSSWKYGLITIATLLHDILIPVGAYAVIAHYQHIEIDTLFVVAILTVLGLSVHDSIVVLDRVRENLKENKNNDSFAHVVGKSTSQTIARSINITLTVVFVLIPLYLIGPETTKNFALLLIIGLFIGVYSSIFFGSPLLVIWNSFTENRKKKLATNKK